MKEFSLILVHALRIQLKNKEKTFEVKHAKVQLRNPSMKPLNPKNQRQTNRPTRKLEVSTS